MDVEKIGRSKMGDIELKATEVYQEWVKQFNPPCVYTVCIHGRISGGPGYVGFDSCDLPQHASVRYGCDRCPDDCPDAEYNPNLTTFESFLKYACTPELNSLITDYVDVDIQSIDEVKAYNAKIIAVNKRKELLEEHSFHKVAAMDLPTVTLQTNPFAEYQ